MNLGNSSKHSDEDSGGRLRLSCVYIHGIGVPFPFVDRVHPMLSYMLIWRRHLLLLSLSVMVILGPTYAREVRVIDSLRHFYYIAT